MSFDWLAPHYGWMETVLAGPWLQRARLAWAEELAGCEHLLVVGIGHGRELGPLLRMHPALRITAVDASAGMLQAARCRLPAAEAARVEWVQAVLPAWTPPSAGFDVVATPFFLDCFPPGELAAVVRTLAGATRPGAIWLLSDFAVPERGLAHWRARVIHAAMYVFFRWATRLPARRLTSPDVLLAQAGFVLGGRRRFNFGLIHADVWRRI